MTVTDVQGQTFLSTKVSNGRRMSTDANARATIEVAWSRFIVKFASTFMMESILCKSTLEERTITCDAELTCADMKADLRS